MAAPKRQNRTRQRVVERSTATIEDCTASAPNQHQKTIGREDALQMYLALGHERSLKDLHRKILRQGYVGPGERTLKTWSKERSWAHQAKVYDAEMAERAAKPIHDRIADARTAAMSALSDGATRMVEDVRRQISGEAPVEIKTASDLAIYVRAACEMLKQFDEMYGMELRARQDSKAAAEEDGPDLDTLREEYREAVEELEKRGIKVH